MYNFKYKTYTFIRDSQKNTQTHMAYKHKENKDVTQLKFK